MVAVSVIVPIHATQEQHVKWCRDAINSVLDQTFEDWELILVNDQSPQSLRPLEDLFQKDSRLRGAKTEPDRRGVVNARNLGASLAQGEFLLALDADDLLPPNSLKVQVDVLSKRKKGFVYGNTLIRLQDAERIYQAPPYDFDQLLKSLFMPVGSLHFRSDWEKVGGWSPEMEGGLEDWEYWIKLGEAGVCGHHIDVVTYIYRRHPKSRLSELRSSGAYDFAYATMRARHVDVYAGRKPMGCCGGGVRPRSRTQPPTQTVDAAAFAAAAEVTDQSLVRVIFTGNAAGTYIYGRPSGIRYYCPGKGKHLTMMDGRVGVDPRDVPFLTRIHGGRDFRVDNG